MAHAGETPRPRPVRISAPALAALAAD